LKKSTRGILVSIFLMAVAGSMLMATSCKKPPAAPPIGEAPGKTEIVMSGLAFKPASITVKTGTTITWKNNDAVPHTVTERNNMFDSGSLVSGATFSYTFQTKGAYDYYCAVHLLMTGKIIVE
jgi:plastocyanin